VFAQGGFPISEKQAKEKLKKLKAYYPQVFDFHREMTEVGESGQVIHNLFGRPIKLQPHENAHMQFFNTLIQSSASDLNLRACQKAEVAWRSAGLSAAPLLVIHDCIIAESPAREAQAADKILVECMTGFNLESINGPIKLKVEGKISERWTK
jgi:DNA polymerase I-like protein with 3'-5' exonuclease and polymerase domains